MGQATRRDTRWSGAIAPLTIAALIHAALAALPIPWPGHPAPQESLRIQAIIALAPALEPATKAPIAASEGPVQAKRAAQIAKEPAQIARPRPARSPLRREPAIEPAGEPAIEPVADTEPPAMEPIIAPVALSPALDALPSAPPPAPTSAVQARGFDPTGYAIAARQRMERHKRYPARARRQGQHGVAVVRVVIEPNGQISALDLRASSGVAALDREALRMARAAAPYPPHPSGRAIAIDVPVRFRR